MSALETALTIVAGGGAGAVVALVTPWAQWGVEKRRARNARRVDILRGARELVHQGQAASRDTLLTDPRYLAIRPYLSTQVEETLRAQTIHVVSDTYGTVGNYYLAQIRNEADRLETEVWKL